jgi:Polymer-forming cytoskeletal
MSSSAAARILVEEDIEEKPSPEIDFDPAPYFSKWLEAVNVFRFRQPAEPSPGVLLNGHELDDEGIPCFDDQLLEKLETLGTLVVAEHGQLSGDVEVSVALIDGVFKGNITATEHVVVENHGVVIGDITTPKLMIRGGAIIEGKCEMGKMKENSEPPVQSARKESFVKVLRGRLFH